MWKFDVLNYIDSGLWQIQSDVGIPSDVSDPSDPSYVRNKVM